jgi:Holliday junction DNA helicase RuvA
VPSGRSAPAAWREQVRAGLVSLGWQAREADQAVAAVEADLTDPDSPGAAPGADLDTAVILRAALRKLSRA